MLQVVSKNYVRFGWMTPPQIPVRPQQYQKRMSEMNNIYEKEIYGVDVSDFKAFKLTKSLFPQDVVDQYSSNNRFHFLVHARQFGIKPPTEKGMKRTEKRNANEKAKMEAIAKAPAPTGKNAPAQKLAMKSPEDIVLKCARKVCIEKLDKQFKDGLAKKAKIPAKSTNPIRLVTTIGRRGKMRRGRQTRQVIRPQIVINPTKSIYFQKKKANQIRRRAEKKQLIIDYKEELKAIYGDIIFTRGWRISRQDIKKALGLPEDAPYEYDVGEELFQEAHQPQTHTLPLDTITTQKWTHTEAEIRALLDPKFKFTLPATTQEMDDEFPSLISPSPNMVSVSAFARKK